MQQIHVWRKRRPGPRLRVANILTLKKKAHFFRRRNACARRRALAPFLRVAVWAVVGGCRRLRRHHCLNLCLNVRILSDFGGGDTHGGNGVRCAHRPPLVGPSPRLLNYLLCPLKKVNSNTEHPVSFLSSKGLKNIFF
jgi:hypothetical protein